MAIPATDPTTASAMVKGLVPDEDEDEEGVEDDDPVEPVARGEDVVPALEFGCVTVDSPFEGLVVVAAVFCAGMAVNPLCVQ